MNSLVFEVQCTDPDDILVVKLYRDPDRWKMAKEAFVYGLLDGDVIPVPRIVASDDSGSTIPQAYLVMSKLPGELAAGVLPSLPTTKVEAVYRQVGAILREIHRVEFDSFGYLSTDVVEPHPTNVAYMVYQFEWVLETFGNLGGDRAIRLGGERTVERWGSLLAGARKAVLCHNDLHEGNLLVLEKVGDWQVSGALDVEGAVAGDPLLDLAKTDYYFRGDAIKRRGLLDGYGALASETEEAMRLYELYHALELWVWFASNGNEAPLAGLSDDLRALASHRDLPPIRGW